MPTEKVLKLMSNNLLAFEIQFFLSETVKLILINFRHLLTISYSCVFCTNTFYKFKQYVILENMSSFDSKAERRNSSKSSFRSSSMSEIGDCDKMKRDPVQELAR